MRTFLPGPVGIDGQVPVFAGGANVVECVEIEPVLVPELPLPLPPPVIGPL